MKCSVLLLNETKQTCSRSSGPRPRPIHLHTYSRSLPKLIVRRHRRGCLRRCSLEQATSSSLVEEGHTENTFYG
ncbi:hypothetical protein I3760_10G059300 [Carya illinoinensis]|nr:hypothetical protein I3760_10G059300 [Carya illinoinensis]